MLHLSIKSIRSHRARVMSVVRESGRGAMEGFQPPRKMPRLGNSVGERSTDLPTGLVPSAAEP